MIVNETVDELVLRYQQGEPDALGALHEALTPAILTAIRRVSFHGLPASVNPEDVLQETYVLLSELAAHWEPRGAPFASYVWSYFAKVLRRWLWREEGRDAVGKRRCISVPHDHLVNTIGGYTIRGSAPERAAVLADYLGVLPADQRRAVELSVLEGASFEDIGPLLGVSRATAHRLYTRGLATLRETIGVSA